MEIFPKFLTKVRIRMAVIDCKVCEQSVTARSSGVVCAVVPYSLRGTEGVDLLPV